MVLSDGDIHVLTDSDDKFKKYCENIVKVLLISIK